MGALYMVYNIGPTTDPWGTPQLLVTEFDRESRTLQRENDHINMMSATPELYLPIHRAV